MTTSAAAGGASGRRRHRRRAGRGRRRVRARHARRLHGPDLLRPPRPPDDPHRPGARGVDRRPRWPRPTAASPAGPLVVMGQGEWIAGNAGQGFLEALLGSSPIVILTEMSDGGALSHHAPYQSGTGDYGTWDARSALAGVTKRVMVSHDPAQAVQHVQLALKHALTGEPGPVAVIFHSSALRGTVGPDSTPRIYPTAAYLPRRSDAVDAAALAGAVAALDGAARPVIIAGNGVRVGQACAAAGRAGPGPRRPGRHHGQRQGRVRRDRSAGRRRDRAVRLAERQRGRRRRRRRARRRHQARPPRHRRRARRPARPEPPDADPDRRRAAQRSVDVPRRPRPRRRRRRRARPPARRPCAAPARAGATGGATASPRRSTATTSSPPRSSRTTTCRWLPAADHQRPARGVPRRRHRHLRRRREPAVHDALVPLEDAGATTCSRPPAAAWATPCRPRWPPSWPTPTARSLAVCGDGGFAMSIHALMTAVQERPARSACSCSTTAPSAGSCTAWARRPWPPASTRSTTPPSPRSIGCDGVRVESVERPARRHQGVARRHPAVRHRRADVAGDVVPRRHPGHRRPGAGAEARPDR